MENKGEFLIEKRKEVYRERRPDLKAIALLREYEKLADAKELFDAGYQQYKPEAARWEKLNKQLELENIPELKQRRDRYGKSLTEIQKQWKENASERKLIRQILENQEENRKQLEKKIGKDRWKNRKAKKWNYF